MNSAPVDDSIQITSSERNSAVAASCTPAQDCRSGKRHEGMLWEGSPTAKWTTLQELNFKVVSAVLSAMTLIALTVLSWPYSQTCSTAQCTEADIRIMQNVLDALCDGVVRPMLSCGAVEPFRHGLTWTAMAVQ